LIGQYFIVFFILVLVFKKTTAANTRLLRRK